MARKSMLSEFLDWNFNFDALKSLFQLIILCIIAAFVLGSREILSLILPSIKLYCNFVTAVPLSVTVFFFIIYLLRKHRII